MRFNSTHATAIEQQPDGAASRAWSHASPWRDVIERRSRVAKEVLKRWQ
jgi:hypothetical protein